MVEGKEHRTSGDVEAAAVGSSAGSEPKRETVKEQLQGIIGIVKNMHEEIATGAREGEKAAQQD